MTYEDDRGFESLMMPRVMESIKSRHLLRLADDDKDMKEVSDLQILKAGDIRIGVRMRRPEYLEKFPWDVTFRCKRDTGSATEWSKIQDGWGDLMFYGFANPYWKMFQSIVKWTLVSLHAVRRIVKEGKALPGNPISNHDGTYFYAIDIRRWMTLDSKFVIDKNWSIKGDDHGQII